MLEFGQITRVYFANLDLNSGYDGNFLFYVLMFSYNLTFIT